MSASLEKAKKVVEMLTRNNGLQRLNQSISNKKDPELSSEGLSVDMEVNREGQHNRLSFLNKQTSKSFPFLSGASVIEDVSVMEGNIENYIGMTQVPTGVIGPVSVVGTEANGEFFIPLATSEGALVASYNRGAKACRVSGGVTSICFTEGVQRCPVFKFANLGEVCTFAVWVLQQEEIFKKITCEKSRYAKLNEMKANIEGNHVLLTFEYNPGDAAGQNMVTFCTEAICNYINENSPVKPALWFIEGNYAGDKKATSHSFIGVRGKKVSAEVELPASVVRGVLKTTPDLIHEYWRTSTMGVIQSGAIGAQGHYANGLAAIFMATGQDVACVSEASVGLTRMEVTPEGNLYAAVTLPNLIIGTVGGGTGLPTQREALEMMDCFGAGKARKFAEIIGAVILGGELSIAAALSAGHFAAAHKQLGRKK